MSRDRDRAGDVARVYIGDLGSGGSKPELEREFERYGPLKSVWVARNPPGKAFIYFFLGLISLEFNFTISPMLLQRITCEAKLFGFSEQ